MSGSGPRFLVACVAGLVVDLAFARLLLVLELPLAVAGATSQIAAAALMYAVHEKWTFRTGRPLSFGRLAGTLWASLGALIVRVSCLWISSVALGMGDAFATAQLVAAAGASFVFSFVVVRRIMSVRAADAP